jgi:hypothetical protein
MPNPYETWDYYPEPKPKPEPDQVAQREDPRPEEIEQRTAELGRGLEALVWFQDWVTDVLAGVGAAEAGDDYKVTQERPASKVQWVVQERGQVPWPSPGVRCPRGLVHGR